MDVFFETENGSTFCIKLGYWYTVLEIKQEIEKRQRIPVSKQTLFFKGKALQDEHDVEECLIFHNSRIHLFVSTEDNPSNVQVLQTEQPPLSNTIEGIFNDQDWSFTTQQLINVQDFPVTLGRNNMNTDQGLQTDEFRLLNSVEQFSNAQDLPRMVGRNRNDQVLETEQSPVQSYSTGNITYCQDWPLMTNEEIQRVKQFLPEQTIPVKVGSNQNNNQMLQTEHSPVPSHSTGNIQDWPLMTNEEIQTMQQFLPEQTIPVRVGSNQKYNQMLQTEKSPVPSYSTGNMYYGQDWPLMTAEEIHTMQQFYPPGMMEGNNSNNSAEQFIDVQDFPVTFGSNNRMLQTEQSPPLKSTEQFINNNDHVLQTKQSPPSDLVKEVINIPDSPVKVRRSSNKPPRRLRVMVTSHCDETRRKIPVDVNAGGKVAELRNKLDKIQQRGELDLPEERYFFIHKGNVLDDDQTFGWNHVNPGDTVEAFPGHVTPVDPSSVHRGF